MRVSKRQFLGGSAALGAATLISPASASERPLLALYDSRIALSKAFAQLQEMTGVTLLDVVQQEQTQWRKLRDHHGKGRVVGLTSWADWVAISSHLSEKGLRVVALQHQALGHGTLFQWELA